MSDISTNIGPLALKNPVMTASGTFGFGLDFMRYGDVSTLGAVVTKSVTLKPRAGNPSPRIYETPSGMLNSIGLENPGVDYFRKKTLPMLRDTGVTIIVNIAGENVDEYKKLGGMFSDKDGVLALEVNAGCPNVDLGGMQFGRDCGVIAQLIEAVKGATSLPLIAKLTPNVADIAPIAKAACEAGAVAVSLINTLLGMSVDVRKRVSYIKRGVAGLSGPAVRPVAVRMAWEAAKTGVPVIGAGGICDVESAMQFLLVGAKAVQVGTSNFTDPTFVFRLPALLSDFLDEMHVPKLSSYIGSLKTS